MMKKLTTAIAATLALSGCTTTTDGTATAPSALTPLSQTTTTTAPRQTDSEEVEGNYRMTWLENGMTNDLSFTPCGSGCLLVETIDPVNNWMMSARKVGGVWSGTVNDPNGIDCGDGAFGFSLAHWSFNFETLEGTRQRETPVPICGDATAEDGVYPPARFSLTKLR